MYIRTCTRVHLSRRAPIPSCAEPLPGSSPTQSPCFDWGSWSPVTQRWLRQQVHTSSAEGCSYLWTCELATTVLQEDAFTLAHPAGKHLLDFSAAGSSLGLQFITEILWNICKKVSLNPLQRRWSPLPLHFWLYAE